MPRAGLLRAIGLGMILLGVTARLVHPSHAIAADQTLWPAIGQITYGHNRTGSAICTGTLVAPNLVLTAGHCLRARGEGKAMDPATVHFAPGWRDGTALATRSGTEVILSGTGGLAGDLALLVLDTPIPTGVATPIPLAGNTPASPLIFVGYRKDEPDTPYQQDCPIIGTEAAVLGLGCEAVSGNSGAPVLTKATGAWQLAGVMVARSRVPGPVGSYAAIPGSALILRIAQP